MSGVLRVCVRACVCVRVRACEDICSFLNQSASLLDKNNIAVSFSDTVLLYCRVTVDLPYPVVVMNGSLVTPNQSPLPQFRAGSNISVTCRSLLRTVNDHEAGLLTTSVEWRRLPPRAVQSAVTVSKQLAQYPSVAFSMFNMEVGRYCMACHGSDFAGQAVTEQCFHVVADGEL